MNERPAEMDIFTRLAAMKPGERWVYYTGSSLGEAATKNPRLAVTRDGLWEAAQRGVCALNIKRKSWGKTVTRSDGRHQYNVGSEFEYIATRR